MTHCSLHIAAGGYVDCYTIGIVPVTDKNTGAKSLSLKFRALLGFHKLYSRTLLRAACSRLSHR